MQRHLFAFRDKQKAKAEAAKAQQEDVQPEVVQRFRMEYCPRVTGDNIHLYHDPSIPDFFARCVSPHLGMTGH